MKGKVVFILLGLGIVAGVVWSLATDGILHHLLRSGLSAAERVDLVRDYFLSWGALAPVIYVLVVTIEVIVAPIPGLMLYAPGGLVFGGFYGGLLSLIGNVIGAGLAAAMARSLAGEHLERFFQKKKIRAVVERLRDAGVWVILALRINPLTTSDLVSYAAGLAGIPLWKVMVGTAIGMAPLCWAQAYLADTLFTAVPWLLYPLAIIAIGYVLVAIFFIRKTLAPE